jgi:hypothetical protein
MSLSSNITLLLIGAGISLAAAAIGSFLEYWLSLRTNGNNGRRRLPGCLFYVAGGLALAGIIALVGSFLFNGVIQPAHIVGVGLIFGFFLGFV